MAPPTRKIARITGASLLVLGMVWQHVQATRFGYEIELSRKEIRRLRSEVAALSVELETEISPAQLSLRARKDLGMELPHPSQLRLLGPTTAPGAKETLLGRLRRKPLRLLAS